MSTGVHTYIPHPTLPIYLVPAGPNLLLTQNTPFGVVHKTIYTTPEGRPTPVDPRFCPGGVSFVLSSDIYLLPLDSCSSSSADWKVGDVRRLTRGGDDDGITCGIADYISQEEMDQYRGYWFCSRNSGKDKEVRGSEERREAII
jgi:hypothetical protein